MVHRLHSLCLGLTLLALAPGAATLAAQESAPAPRITFTKTLKGSNPEYMAVIIDANGKGTYSSHALGDTATPRPLQTSPATAAQIFSLAQSLQNFRDIDLDTRHKVANMGLKTLTYEAGMESHRVEYNYTENRSAQQLTEIFEKISNVEERIAQLEYEMKYDHLNLPQTLDQIEGDMAEHNLVEGALMIPTLVKISNDTRFLHLARARAQEIMQNIHEDK